MSKRPPAVGGTHASSASTNSGGAFQHVTGQSSTCNVLEGPLWSPLVARKKTRVESPCLATDATTSSTSTGGTQSAPRSPIIHSVAPSATSRVATCIDCAQEKEEMHYDQQDGHDGNGDDQEIRQAAGEHEDGDNRRRFFRFEVNPALPLGAEAFPPVHTVSILWQLGTVTEGSQAEELGIEKDHYIYSVCGKRVFGRDKLQSLILAARRASATYELVTTDMPMTEYPRNIIGNENAPPTAFDQALDRGVARGTGRAHGAGPDTNGARRGILVRNSDAASSPQKVGRIEETLPSLTALDGGASIVGTPTKRERNMEVMASPAVRRAMMSAQKSPESKSPYHSFHRARRSIVPAGTDTGTVSLNFDILRHELRKRIKECIKGLCIFPEDDTRPWLDYALNLVFATLWYNSPDRGLGWGEDVDRIRLLGIKADLKGPQPWMATRAFIVSCVTDMLDAEGSDWIRSVSRKDALKKFHEPRIKKYLKAWKEELAQPRSCQSLQIYADGVWGRFVIDHLAGDDDAVVPLAKLTERYVCSVADMLDDRKMCPPVSGVSMSRKQLEQSSSAPSVASEISRHVKGLCLCAENGCTCKCKKLRYEVFPFANDLDSVTKAVLRRFQDNHIRLFKSHVTYHSVRAVLDDLEDESNFVTRLNKLFVVTIKASGIPMNGDIDGPCESGTSYGARVEGKRRAYSTEKVLGARVYAEFTDGQYYWGQITKVNSTKATGGLRYFEVTFEDGEILPNVSEKEMITEIEYIPLFELYPPEPEKGSLLKKSKKKRKGRSRPPRKLSASEEGSETLSSTRNSSSMSTSSVHEKKNYSSTPSATLEFIKQYVCQQKGNWSLSKLQMKRCGTCVLCVKQDCGLCSTCRQHIHNAADGEAESTPKSTHKLPQEVCIRKICCRILEKRRAQPAVGFSPGWMFYYLGRRLIPSISIGHSDTDTGSGIRIISPEGRVYTSIEQAASHGASSQINKDDAVQLFRSHVGLARYEVDLSHFLIGRGYCCEWTNAEGRNQIIYGVVSRCIKSTGTEAVMFTINYNEDSRALINQTFGCDIDPSQEISSDLAWGGCLNYERKTKVRRSSERVIKNLRKDMPCRYLIVPDMRKEELVEYNGAMLPKLTFVVRGHQLVFNVKQSTIPNAGYGLFVRCKSLTNDFSSKTDSARAFLLKAGELLDMGVYGPLRHEDEKLVHVHSIKSYIFSGKNEEWCFTGASEDSIYDVTDDKTGDVHDLALRSCLTYINECGSDDAPTIHASVDPCGCVHYLMGTRYHGDWNRYKEESSRFSLAVDGDEVEVFLHYGQSYEPIRIRKGYSVWSTPSLQRQQEELATTVMTDHDCYISDIATYNAEEVIDCVYFLTNQCLIVEDYKSTEKRIDEDVRDRVQRVVRKLLDRASELLQITEDKNTHGQSQNGHHCCSSMKELSKAVADARTYVSSLQELPCCVEQKSSGIDGIDSESRCGGSLNELFSSVLEQASDESFV